MIYLYDNISHLILNNHMTSELKSSLFQGMLPFPSVLMLIVLHDTCQRTLKHASYQPQINSMNIRHAATTTYQFSKDMFCFLATGLAWDVIVGSSFNFFLSVTSFLCLMIVFLLFHFYIYFGNNAIVLKHIEKLVLVFYSIDIQSIQFGKFWNVFRQGFYTIVSSSAWFTSNTLANKTHTPISVQYRCIHMVTQRRNIRINIIHNYIINKKHSQFLFTFIQIVVINTATIFHQQLQYNSSYI